MVEARQKMRSIQLVLGTFLMAVAYKTIFDSVQMVTGGFSGIGIIVRHVTFEYVDGGIPIWVTNIILNIPLFIVSYITKGRRFVMNTLVGTVMLTLYLGILPGSYVSEADYLLAAVVGGVTYGIGIGLVLKSGATTGGTDMLAVVMTKFIKNYSVVRIMQFLDGAIILAGMLLFGIRVSIYAIIAIYIGTIVSDRIIEGAKSGKAVWIISDKYDEISQQVMQELGRGITLLSGRGMYTNKKKDVLLCVISRKQIPELKKIVESTDSNAFLVIGDVREICGEGFVQI